MAEYTINCKLEASIAFTVSAESLEDAITKGREKAKKLRPFAKGIDWNDGHPEVDGVFENY